MSSFHRAPLAALIAATLLATSLARPASADLIRLKSGGEIRGQVDRATSGLSSREVTIESITGATIVVERDDIAFVSRRPLIVEEYETRARRAPLTLKDQWELAEWCRENSLKSYREVHLEKVLELDPAHEEAHQALGHILSEGEWLTRDELMTRQGYVKYKGKYITPQELELAEKSRAQLDAEREWFGKVRLWYGWLNGRNDDRSRQALAEFQGISDASAIPALSRTFRNDGNKSLRALYVEVLSRIPSDAAVAALASQSLHDDDYQIRYVSLNGIEPKSYAVARPIYLSELKNKNNTIVCRAGQALGRVGDESCVPALIQALTTTHVYRVAIPEKKGGVSFGTNGQFSLGGAGGQMIVPPEIQAMIASGQISPNALMQGTGPPDRVRIVNIKHEHQNVDVLATLQKLTGESHGYDKRSWNLWWTSKKNSGA